MELQYAKDENTVSNQIICPPFKFCFILKEWKQLKLIFAKTKKYGFKGRFISYLFYLRVIELPY